MSIRRLFLSVAIRTRKRLQSIAGKSLPAQHCEYSKSTMPNLINNVNRPAASGTVYAVSGNDKLRMYSLFPGIQSRIFTFAHRRGPSPRPRSITLRNLPTGPLALRSGNEPLRRNLYSLCFRQGFLTSSTSFMRCYPILCTTYEICQAGIFQM